MSDNLRSKVIRLAHSKPELRETLLPLLKQAAPKLTKEQLDLLEWNYALEEGDARENVGLALRYVKKVLNLSTADEHPGFQIKVFSAMTVEGFFENIRQGRLPYGSRPTAEEEKPFEEWFKKRLNADEQKDTPRTKKERASTSVVVVPGSSNPFVAPYDIGRGEYEGYVIVPSTLASTLVDWSLAQAFLSDYDFAFPKELVETTDVLQGVVDSLYTYFDLEIRTPKKLIYRTRENGDASEKKPGQADILAARKMKKNLLAKFRTAIAVNVSVKDEWVSLTVSLRS